MPDTLRNMRWITCEEIPADPSVGIPAARIVVCPEFEITFPVEEVIGDPNSIRRGPASRGLARWFARNGQEALERGEVEIVWAYADQLRDLEPGEIIDEQVNVIVWTEMRRRRNRTRQADFASTHELVAKAEATIRAFGRVRAGRTEAALPSDPQEATLAALATALDAIEDAWVRF